MIVVGVLGFFLTRIRKMAIISRASRPAGGDSVRAHASLPGSFFIDRMAKEAFDSVVRYVYRPK